jgi:hypothetical protein
VLDLSKTAHSCKRNPAVSFQVATGGGGQNTLCAGEAPEDFVRAGEVELGDARIKLTPNSRYARR